MNISVPIYTETLHESGGVTYHCAPLFVPAMSGRDRSLSKAMGKMMKKLKQYADSLAARSRHDALVNFAFNPALETRTLKLSLDLRDRIAKCKLLFVEMSLLDRRIAFSPSIPDVWFELNRGESLTDRAADVLSQHFREQAKVQRDSGGSVDVPSVSGQPWVTVVDVSVTGGAVARRETEERLASLWDDSKMHGATELDRVGRCLDWLYPDDLKRAVFREREVAELQRLLSGVDRRPVLLVGPRLSGKTSVLHQFVAARVAARKRPFSAKRNVWLLSPQRLISGMSYVGQWENRLLAILKEAKRRDHVLYFDDVMGLYQAGVSADSRLCVADVLRSSVLQRDVRVVGEMTPESFAKFQERDRGLADQFHILPVAPTNEDTTLRILLHVRRQQEAEHQCRFAPDAIPTVLEITGRYEREAAQPGKAATLLQHLAAKCPHGKEALRARGQIDRGVVYEEYHAKTGLSLLLLDKRVALSRRKVRERLAGEIVGQAEAIDVCTDVMMVAKAGLNDPTQPLATLLFLGPTGVGKTQCAKALTKALFTDESRLLRFDMNEFVSAHSAARLIGTFQEPEGLLTSAVRRQPHAVILFDEIEKAHPDVFDLLLQLTGEGRLTDALGRTANFSNAVVVMTSNLGVHESASSLGLRSDATNRRQTFINAAERFFLPEFFNRIDRVVPFGQLDRGEMQVIAELLLEDLLKREGLVRRRCALQVDERAMQRIVTEGYHPQLGARALKRAIEKQLAQPLAVHLSAATSNAPTLINVYAGPEGLLADVHLLEPVRRVAGDSADEPSTNEPSTNEPSTNEPSTNEPSAAVEHNLKIARRIEVQLSAARPAFEVAADRIGPEQLRYFALKEQVHEVVDLAESLRRQLEDARHGPVRPELGTSVRGVSHHEMSMLERGSQKRFAREIQSSEDINEFVRESAALASTPAAELERSLQRLKQQTAWLWAMWQGRDQAERVALLLRNADGGRADDGRADAAVLRRLQSQYAGTVGQRLLFDHQELRLAEPDLAAILFTGAFIWPLLNGEQGVHLIRQSPGNLVPVLVSLLPVDESADPIAAIEQHNGRRNAWLDGLASGGATLADNPCPPGGLVRVFDDGGVTEDMRSGMQIEGWPTPDVFQELLLAGLEAPPGSED